MARTKNQGKIGVKEVSTNELIPNPHNPRMLFDALPLKSLQESIERNGILVPLTVYYEATKKRYIILDGQRRWICAQRLDLETVPVNEVERPSLVQNIVTMFQIHKLREDWELMPTALKLKVLMEETGDRNNKSLSALTGLDEAVVVRCKKLLSYPSKYHNMMLEMNPERRRKADFFIELYPVLHDRNVQAFEWFKADKFTRQMLAKADAKGIKSVTDFRTVKGHITNAVKARRKAAISKRLREFAEQPECTVEHLALASAEIHKTAQRLTKVASKLRGEIVAIDVSEYYGEEDLWQALEGLSADIAKKLVAAGRRLRG